jgi:hypothetical protein
MHLFDMAPDDPALRDHESMRTRVDEALEYYGEVEGAEHLPRWLLLDDEMLSYPTDVLADAKGTVDAAVVVLGDELPHLRILRLGKPAPGELNYAMNIGGLWRKPL